MPTRGLTLLGTRGQIKRVQGFFSPPADLLLQPESNGLSSPNPDFATRPRKGATLVPPPRGSSADRTIINSTGAGGRDILAERELVRRGGGAKSLLTVSDFCHGFGGQEGCNGTAIALYSVVLHSFELGKLINYSYII